MDLYCAFTEDGINKLNGELNQLRKQLTQADTIVRNNPQLIAFLLGKLEGLTVVLNNLVKDEKEKAEEAVPSEGKDRAG